MKFLIIDTYYDQVLIDFHNNKEIVGDNFENTRRALLDKLFGTADFYSKNLIELGHEAQDIIINDQILQGLWAKERGIKNRNFYSKILNIPKIGFIGKKVDTFLNLSDTYKILKAQIEEYKPDIIYVQNLGYLNSRFLKSIKPNVKLIIGQIACPLPPLRNLKPYDLILTSFPHYVEIFRKMGIKSEYFKIGFEESILSKLKKERETYQTTFIGGFANVHKEGTTILEEVAEKTKLDFWGYGVKDLKSNSPIIKNYHGEAWGADMYQILYNSKITINRHSLASKNYANNMRLYEATGVGTMLLTDIKDNLSELFEIDKEIVTYKTPEEMLEKIQYYSNHEKERSEIALAGQKRTLKDHTYKKRMQELVKIIEKYL